MTTNSSEVRFDHFDKARKLYDPKFSVPMAITDPDNFGKFIWKQQKDGAPAEIIKCVLVPSPHLLDYNSAPER